jgi:hypothetical protein
MVEQLEAPQNKRRQVNQYHMIATLLFMHKQTSTTPEVVKLRAKKERIKIAFMRSALDGRWCWLNAKPCHHAPT